MQLSHLQAQELSAFIAAALPWKGSRGRTSQQSFAKNLVHSFALTSFDLDQLELCHCLAQTFQLSLDKKKSFEKPSFNFDKKSSLEKTNFHNKSLDKNNFQQTSSQKNSFDNIFFDKNILQHLFFNNFDLSFHNKNKELDEHNLAFNLFDQLQL